MRTAVIMTSLSSEQHPGRDHDLAQSARRSVIKGLMLPGPDQVRDHMWWVGSPPGPWPARWARCPTVTAVSPRKARRLPAGMPRRPRGGVPRDRPGGPGGDGDADGSALRLGPERAESAPDGDWVTRLVPGSASAKTYRCPGCDQEIPPGTAHLVAWPAHSRDAADRRHWHNPCWQRRLQRHTRARRGGR